MKLEQSVLQAKREPPESLVLRVQLDQMGLQAPQVLLVKQV